MIELKHLLGCCTLPVSMRRFPQLFTLFWMASFTSSMLLSLDRLMYI